MILKDDVVLVTGGTGFTGAVLVKKLCKIGCRVRVIARPSSDRAQFEGLDIEWVLGNVYDPNVIRKAAVDVNYIFHVAAAYREAKLGDDVYRWVHVDSTKLLAEQACRNPQFKRFLHVSTIGVLGHVENPPADETAPYNPGDIYQDTKAEAEQWILAYGKNNTFPVTVVRPAAIYGPNDRRLLKLFKLAKLPVVPILGFTKGLYQLIHVEDLADFMILAATQNKTVGEIYICGNPHSISIKQIVQVISSHIGKKPFFVRLPAAPFFLLGWLCELICKPLNVEPPIYRRRVAFFTKDRSFNTEKMARDTNFKYRYSNEEGLLQTTDWYQKHHWM